MVGNLTRGFVLSGQTLPPEMPLHSQPTYWVLTGCSLHSTSSREKGERGPTGVGPCLLYTGTFTLSLPCWCAPGSIPVTVTVTSELTASLVTHDVITTLK